MAIGLAHPPDGGTLVGALGLAGSAGAGVTYDVAFRSTDNSGAAIAGGSVSGGGHTFTFSSTSAANACNTSINAGCVVLDVFLRTTTPLFSASVSESFDNFKRLRAGALLNATCTCFDTYSDKKGTISSQPVIPMAIFLAQIELRDEDAGHLALPSGPPFGRRPRTPTEND